MALKLKSYTFQDQEFQDVYVRIQKITISISDMETEKELSDRTIIEFTPTVECAAFAFIYASQEARQQNVRPLTRIGFIFPYDYTSGGNPYKAAYQALKNDLIVNNNEVADI